MNVIQNMWMLLILPVLASALTGLPRAGFSIPKRRVTLFLTLFSSGLSLLLVLFGLNQLSNNPGTFFEADVLFLNAGIFKIHLGVLLDNISAFMLSVLYVITLAVSVFSYKYMQNEAGFSRYFIFLNLFVFSMAGLILSTNLIQFYIFWELVGLFSYLLIGFYIKKPEAGRAARKVFLINRIGDFALFIAVLGFSFFVMQDIESILYPMLSLKDVSSWGLLAYVQLGPLLYAGICLLVVLGAAVKSAQIPFQIWLADAMEGPTPISALIHGATMVTAGVYLLIRLYPALFLSPITLKTVAILGITTAIACAFIAMTQNDVKKILAFSTSSQLGLMFTAIGLGAYSGCILHLGLHGISKAMLFLVLGIIIQKTMVQNVKFLGGLREHMPVTAALWLLGALSVSGVFFSGFYSKEMIMSHIYTAGQYVFLALFIFAGFLSVIYLFRSYFLIFEGAYKGSYDFSQDKNKPYDGTSLFLLVPTGFLALFCAFFGGFIAPNFQRHIYIMRQKLYFARHPELEIFVFVITGLIIYLLWRVYGSRNLKIRRFRLLYRIIVLQFYINKGFEAVYKIFIKGTAKVINALDKYILNGVYTLVAQVTRFGAYLCLRLQNGKITSYAFYSFLFATAVLLCAVIVYLKGVSQYGG